MAHLKLQLKTLGLCLSALGIVLLSASVAQAEVGANWMVNGSNISFSLFPEVQVESIENKTGSLLFTTKGGTKVEVLCTSAAMTFSRLESVGKFSSGLGVIFSGCLVKLNGSVAAACKPFSEFESGVIRTHTLTGLIVLREFESKVELKAFAGGSLADIKLGEECSIGEILPVTGEVFIKDASLKTEQVSHLITPAPALFTRVLGQPVSFDGSATVRLSGAHTSMQWSGLPA